MPMNPRLLAPRQTAHPEALAWRAAVIANGGSVIGSTLNAVSNWFKEIAPVRSRVYRASAFAGPDLPSVLVPFIRGPVFGGTTYGNATDSNTNFVSGNVSLAGGIDATSNSNKYLNTGFPTNTLSASSRHLGFLELSRGGRTFDVAIGSESAAGSGQQPFWLGYSGASSVTYASFSGLGGAASSAATTTGAFWLGVSPDDISSQVYKNGVAEGTAGSAAAATPTASEIFVFALNRASTPGATDYYGGIGGGYSIGLSMTANQALVYSNAWIRLTTALGRTIT